MRAITAIFSLALIATTSCSLLEMSQTLWTKALEGGLTKIGPLDPLRIPIVKVDQSEGNTSYRMILRSVEIRGLNKSSLESIHIGRGPLRSNLSEHEAGYVSYTDQRDIDMIRYRFHTVVKEPKVDESRNLRVKEAPSIRKSMKNENSREGDKNCDFSSRNDENREESSRSRGNEEKTFSQGRRIEHEPSSRNENPRDETGHHAPLGDSQPLGYQQDSSRFAGRFSADRTHPAYRGDSKNAPARVIYAENRRYPEDDYRSRDADATERSAASGCTGNCEYRSYDRSPGDNQGRYEGRNGQEDDIRTAATSSFETRGSYVRLNPRLRESENPRIRDRNFQDSRGEIGRDESKNFNRREHEDFGARSSSQRLENRPGYVDILYADGGDHKVKHFGNFRVETGSDKSVYSFDDVLKDIQRYNRFIIHNFTEGAALTKRNDAVRMASETKRIEDLARYAKDFQEKNGYYEQGMYLVYHYGGDDDFVVIDDKAGRRTKRAHLDDKDDDDIMHIVMKIHVPMLQVDAGYVLMGNVGKQVLRGNGLLSANFTELIGDFTLELKKVGRDSMIVRAARARLTSGDRRITLQGMEQEGPVNEILTQGLMAAEAVAAMLADDLATKALSENTADSIIYKMYKNLPSN